MPDELTWFKWEAYTTWLSGFALLIVVYYFGAELFLIDKSVLDLSPLAAGAIGLGSLTLAWLAYEAMCRSPLGKHELALALIGYVFLVALTYAFTHVFSGRGAFVQIGAVIGTMCHGEQPVWAGVAAAPGGVMFDQPERIHRQARLIGLYAVRSNAMPPGNVTEMTGEERRTLAAWLASGAPGRCSTSF